MGYAIAEVFAEFGAKVILVSGPVSETLEHPKVEIIPVTTADEMYQKCHYYFPKTSISVLSAAVSDYMPENKIPNKVKRQKEDWSIRLKPTRDIAASLGEIKKNHQFLTGFALETDNELENAKSKLKRKKLDLIVLNSLQDEGAGFQSDTNKIWLIDKNNNIDKFELKSKKEVARDIVEKIIRLKEHD
jgi:phosphopantothenoylcysteine decarboxylase/phosphopantothenate--cysteine ligase